MSKKILLIYTGGTIGMVKDKKTNALKPVNIDSLFKTIPELMKMKCDIEFLSFSTPKDSSNIHPADWIVLSQLISSNYNKYDGFVILHGTDTMAFTASALSFLFRNLNKPVVLTGSQLPSGLYRSDAKENIINSVEVASHYKKNKATIPEVCICFENSLFRGNRTHKVNAEHFNAFESTNYPALATIGVHLNFDPNAVLPYPIEAFKSHSNLNTNVAILKLFPGINKKVLEFLLIDSDIQGLVIETFGTGNVPDFPWLIKAIEKAIKKGKKIVNISQCRGGGVDQKRYSGGFALENIGVISGYDMTLESAITKMMFLLGNAFESKNFKTLMQKSLRGEHSFNLS